ncbi:ferredoxin--NADP reductase [Mongoliitalea daihaiensis]|uniref:ferredoxin--NADP reductase n=1 Tax=Mongoliitalea daihaiensis TaxID=2782006 RepID=UPI001F24E821|nr:ferredoxin--NADP reductase [Mongoliitalea daihaiensis]UJP63666.1 ferredoxin--NADP reductase [Mongoliitalea daihaiensis]
MFNLFKKKKSEPSKGSQYISLKVREVVKETADTVTIYFEQPEPYLEYKPGQFLTLILEIEGKEVRRSYSLCTSPFVDPYPGISVKRVAGGLVSNYLNDQIRPGKTIEIMKPLGNFTTSFHSQNKRNFVMVAGGSGITPIMGILKSVLINEPQSKVSLLYCSRSEEQIIFKKALESLGEKYGDRLEVTHNLSQPGSAWTGWSGRLEEARITEFYHKVSEDTTFDPLFFVCGPEGIMDVTKQTLSALGVSTEQLLSESFYSDLDAKEKTMEAEGKLAPSLTREIEIELEGQTYQVEVSPGKTILDAGLDQDIDMPYSCQSGLCTACRGRLISGKVDMIEDAGLSPSEIAEGFILCCSAKPASGDIKIRIE